MTDLRFAALSGTTTVTCLHYWSDAGDDEFRVHENDCVFFTNGSITASKSFGSISSAPEKSGHKRLEPGLCGNRSLSAVRSSEPSGVQQSYRGVRQEFMYGDRELPDILHFDEGIQRQWCGSEWSDCLQRTGLVTHPVHFQTALVSISREAVQYTQSW